MRLPSKPEIGKLASLSRARERLAMVELAAVTARRNAAAARVRELRDRSDWAAGTQEAAVYQKWLLWRDQEIAKRLQQLAVISAEYAEASRRCGRVIAENAVVETLADQVAQDASEAAVKADLYDLAITSHLLPNDVGDQNI